MGWFSFRGRQNGFSFFLTSLSFFAALLFWGIVYGVVAAVLGETSDEEGLATMISGGGFLISLPFALWVYVSGMVRRLHDMGASGWWLLLCVPLLPIAIVVLIVAPSQKDENRFGSSPW